MLSAIASNGTSVLVADGDAGAAVSPDRPPLIALVGSLMAMSDWEPYDGPVPSYAPADLAEQIAAYRKQADG